MRSALGYPETIGSRSMPENMKLLAALFIGALVGAGVVWLALN